MSYSSDLEVVKLSSLVSDGQGTLMGPFESKVLEAPVVHDQWPLEIKVN